VTFESVPVARNSPKMMAFRGLKRQTVLRLFVISVEFLFVGIDIGFFLQSEQTFPKFDPKFLHYCQEYKRIKSLGYATIPRTITTNPPMD
jgi:hypothetical protein